MSMSVPLCLLCKRMGQSIWDRNAKRERRYCEAYPDGDGIPDAVYWTGHFKPKPGDHGLRFIPSDDANKKMVAYFRSLSEQEDEAYMNYEPLPEGVDA